MRNMTPTIRNSVANVNVKALANVFSASSGVRAALYVKESDVIKHVILKNMNIPPATASRNGRVFTLSPNSLLDYIGGSTSIQVMHRIHSIFCRLLEYQSSFQLTYLVHVYFGIMAVKPVIINFFICGLPTIMQTYAIPHSVST